MTGCGGPGPREAHLRLVDWLPVLGLVVLILSLEIFPLYANDLWMHLLLGRDILEGGIPRWEAYSYTASGRPFVYHEWLAGVLLHGLHGLGGTTALVLLQPLTVLLAAFFLYRTGRSLGSDPDVTALILGVGIYVASFRLFLRPHLLVVPLLAAFWWLLHRFRSRRGLVDPILLLLVQILWTNLHGSFPEGIVLAALFAAGEAIRRRGAASRQEGPPARSLVELALLPVLLLAGSLLNPYGWELHRLALFHPVDPLFQARIFEYMPTLGASFRVTRMFPLYLLWLLVVAAAVLLGRRRVDTAHLIPTAGFLVLSLWMNRAISDLVVVSFPLAALGLSRLGPLMSGRRARWKPLLAGAPLLLAAAGTLAFGYRYDARALRRFGLGVEPFLPVRAADYLERIDLRGNVFCSFPYGSYLAFRLSPAVRVVFDSRTIPYGKELYLDYRDARESLEGLLRHLERYPVDAILLNFRLDDRPEIHAFLSESPDWGLVHFDQEAVLYLRRSPATARLLDRERIRCAHPVLFDLRGIPEGEGPRCQAECERLLAQEPGSVLPRFLLAAALHAQGRPEDALVETERILAVRDDLAYVRRLREEIYRGMGDEARAREEGAAASRLEGGVDRRGP